MDKNTSSDPYKTAAELRSHDNVILASAVGAAGLSFFSPRLSRVFKGLAVLHMGRRYSLVEKHNDAYENQQKQSVIKSADPYTLFNSKELHRAVKLTDEQYKKAHRLYVDSGAQEEIDKIATHIFSPK